MKMTVVFGVLIAILFRLTQANPDENLTVTQLIQKYGYPVETHSYETKDGYILTAHRIPHGVTSSVSKEVVVLAHGMGGIGDNFIILGPPNALAYYLADRGYDVWLYNARGTAHSRKHRFLDPDRDRKMFWNFSWHEMGIYDMPATVDYIKKTTGVNSIYYAGHSQGTTILFVMLSELPEMNKSIRLAACLAPSAYLSYTHFSGLASVARMYELGQMLLEMLGWYELPIPNSPTINNVVKSFCVSASMQQACLDSFGIIGAGEDKLVNKSMMPVIIEHGISGFATKQAWHYAQVIASGEFRQYNYGTMQNLRIYNSTTPPKYNLKNLQSPVALFYSADDPFGNLKMIEEFTKTLPNIVLKYEVKLDGWNHMDYIVAYNAKEVIYEPLYALFKQYENGNNIV